MEYIYFNDSANKPTKLSKIILGVAPFGTAIDKQKSFEIMDYFVSCGGTAIDTARVYCDWLVDGHNVSEKIIGEWIKSRENRKDVNIITKGGHPRFEIIHTSRLSREEIRSDIQDSLETLQTDYIDVYLLHRDDVTRPVSEIMDTLHELVKEGKTRTIGVSNWTVKRIVEANEYAKRNNKTPFSVSEIQWSLAECFPKTYNDDTLVCMNEAEYNDYLKIGIPVIAYSSQAGGIFSCGYKPDLSDAAPKHEKFVTPKNCAIYKSLLKFCEKRNCKPSAASLRYIIDNKLSAGAIIGCSSLEQLKDSMTALELKLTQQDIDEMRN